jgi:hypothetical protein
MNPMLLKTMKITLSILAFGVVCFLSACGGGDPEPSKTQSEKVTEMLTAGTGTWAPANSSGVTVDGVDVTEDLFSGFTITFQDGTLTTTGTSPVWLREDTWQFKDESATTFIRGQDSKEVIIEEVSSSQLKLALEWSETTTSGGRKRSLKGKHVFTLSK